MKVKDLIHVVFDKVTIYRDNGQDFEDIYKGGMDSIPLNILKMEVRIIGASKKGVIDIKVF